MTSAPPIYSTADEAAAWQRFSQPSGLADFYQSWLVILCGQVDRAQAAMLLLMQGAENSYSPAAIWPDPSRNMHYLAAAAQRALAERRGIVVGPDGDEAPLAHQPALIGYPIEIAGKLYGVVVMDIAPGPHDSLQRSLRLVHWASAWLVAHFCRQHIAQRDATLDGLTAVTDLIATALQDRPFGPSALATVNEVCGRMQCDRVSLGVERHGDLKVEAISHTATFDRKSDLVRLIGQAMEEVIDLDVGVVLPQPVVDDVVAVAHLELAHEFKVAAICSVPLIDGGHAFGVMTLERSSGQAFNDDEVELGKTLGLLLGPVFAIKLHDEQGVLDRLRDGGRLTLHAVFGPSHPGVKMFALVTTLLAAFLTLFTTDYRVSASTVVEGEVQRAAAAPFDGFIVQGLARAGDLVKKGQVLARLDDRDLRLEQARWMSERDQAERKYRVALAAQDRGALAVLAAQINQADAQLQLVEERLARASISAPFDGVVVSGDLSQSLGTPVELGKVLFEVAPRDRFRVILKVDERDIKSLKQEQRGELMLSGLPGEVIEFSIKQITPVSTSLEGRNFFRVEAQLAQASARLRPGMEGVGKVLVGQQRLIWIWTHSLTDWLRLSLWTWLP